MGLAIASFIFGVIVGVGITVFFDRSTDEPTGVPVGGFDGDEEREQ